MRCMCRTHENLWVSHCVAATEAPAYKTTVSHYEGWRAKRTDKSGPPVWTVMQLRGIRILSRPGGLSEIYGMAHMVHWPMTACKIKQKPHCNEYSRSTNARSNDIRIRRFWKPNATWSVTHNAAVFRLCVLSYKNCVSRIRNNTDCRYNADNVGEGVKLSGSFEWFTSTVSHFCRIYS